MVDVELLPSDLQRLRVGRRRHLLGTEIFVVTAHRVKGDTLAAVIPKPLREKLGIVKGTKLLVYESEQKLVMQPIKPTSPPKIYKP